MVDLKKLLQTLTEWNGSDLHLKVGSPPMVRVDGALRRVGSEKLMPQDTALVARSIAPPKQLERLERTNEADFAYPAAGVGRFRVNIFLQRGSMSLVMRRV